MSFAQVLNRLRDAARVKPDNDRCVYGDRRIVAREDLAELVQMFDSIDEARRQCIADLKRYHSLLENERRVNPS